MKLYFMPGACSLALHIALREANLRFELVAVDYQSRRLADGQNYFEINPRGYVPLLELEGGEHLSEVPVILQFVDSLVPEASLLPASGMQRLRALEWLNFIATEIHKSFSPLFRPETPDEFLEPGRTHLCRRLGVIEDHLKNQEYLSGTDFSLADVYLFVVCRWLSDQDLSIAHWPAIQRNFDQVRIRRAVRESLVKEGLSL